MNGNRGEDAEADWSALFDRAADRDIGLGAIEAALDAHRSGSDERE
jgi:hypothetical protein